MRHAPFFMQEDVMKRKHVSLCAGVSDHAGESMQVCGAQYQIWHTVWGAVVCRGELLYKNDMSYVEMGKGRSKKKRKEKEEEEEEEEEEERWRRRRRRRRRVK
eukprot:753234-Pelagomonas_calceolata.AAC.7